MKKTLRQVLGLYVFLNFKYLYFFKLIRILDGYFILVTKKL